MNSNDWRLVFILGLFVGILALVLIIYDLGLKEQVISINENIDNLFIYDDCLHYSGKYYCIKDNNGKND